MMFLFGFFVGVFGLLGYMIARMLRSDGWDSSNINNALRLLSHVVLHPEDFGKMIYINENVDWLEEGDFERPFWYVSEDEFETVVNTRPNDGG